MLLRNLAFFFKRGYPANPTTIQWNKTLRSHQANGNYQQALKLFQLGVEKNTFQPNAATYLTVLEICKELKSLPTLRMVHQWIDSTKKGQSNDDDDISRDPRIRSSLMDVYIKCKDLDGAYRVFQAMNERNSIDYSALMTGWNQEGQYQKTVELGKDMPSGMKFSSPVLCTLILRACAQLQRYDDGRAIHQQGKHWLAKDKIFLNEVMNFYLKFHDEKRAFDLFQRYSHQQTVIDYSLFMRYYNRHYQPEKTLDFYHRLRKSSSQSIDHIIYVLVLQAIANGCCLHSSEEIRERVKRFGTQLDVNNALIHMYGNH